MIVVVGGIKGGTGKTTVATNLTVLRALTGNKVLLVDADEQKSASDWADHREGLGIDTNWATIQLSGQQIYHQILRLSKDFDDIIVDVGGRDTSSQRSVLSVADTFLVPFKPRSFDIWTIGPVTQMILDMKAANPKLNCFAFINQADSRGLENDGAESIISKCQDLIFLKTPIGHRKSFAHASAEGLGIAELRTADKKGLNEMITLYEAIWE